MSLYSILLPACLLTTGLLMGPPDLVAQTSDSDTTAPAQADSQRILADSLQKTDTARAASDTVPQPAPPDSASKADSAKATSDSLHPGTSSTSTAPTDSILSSACSGATGPATVAQDLLMVVFAPEAGRDGRAAAAKSVGGRLVGPVGSGEPGAYYLRVPSGGNEYELRAAADQLIKSPDVRQVGSRSCPTPPSASPVKPKP